jgi:hypothetical protein
MGSRKSVHTRKAAPKAAGATRRRRPASTAAAARGPAHSGPTHSGHGHQGRGHPSAHAASDAELDALYAKFLQQPAQLTLKQMNLIERRLCTGDAQWRQLALASLTKSGVELKQRFAATREAAQLAAELLTVADDMGKRLHQLAGLLETASTRLMLSLCERTDMRELIAAARARMEPDATPATSVES